MAREAEVPASLAPELLWHLDLIEARLLSLAEALTPEQYRFRPAPDARAVGEVLLHVSGGNRLAVGGLGGLAISDAELARLEAAPLEKSAIVATLRESLAPLRRLAEATQDFDAAATLFGRKLTRRALFFTVIGHLHQHLGQLIAYARMNGLAPPWSKAA